MTFFGLPSRPLPGQPTPSGLAVDSAALIATSAMTAAVGLGFWALAARYLTPHALGVDTALLSLVTTAGMIAANGTGNAFTALLPVPGCDRGRRLRDGYRIVAFAAVITGAIAAIVAVLTLNIDPVRAAIGILIGTVAMAFFALKDSAMVGLGAARRLPIQNLLASGAKVMAFLALCLWAWHPAYMATVLSAALAAIVVITVPVARLARPRSTETSAVARSAAPSGRDVAMFSLRDGLASTMTMGLSLALPFITTIVAGPVQGAVLGLAQSVAQGLDFIAAGVGTALVAKLSSTTGGLHRQALRTWVVTQLVVLAVATIGFAAAPLAVLFFGAGYRATPIVPVIGVLLLASSVRVAFVIWASVLRSRRRTGTLLVVSAAALLTALPAIIFGARHWGAVGAAAGLCVGSSLLGAVGATALIRQGRVSPADVRRNPVEPGGTVEVLLVNSWHDDNKGDSAITIGTIGLLRRSLAARGFDMSLRVMGLNEPGVLSSTANRHVLAEWPDVREMDCAVPTELGPRDRVRPAIDTPIWLARLLPWALRTLCRRPQPAITAAIEASDLVVVTGGSHLYSDSSVNALLSLARFYTMALPVECASIAGKPALLLGHTLGPFPPGRWITKRVARKMLGTADVAVVREKRSADVAGDLGIQRIRVAPDLAFTLEPRGTGRVRRILNDVSATAGRTIAIAARQHPSLGHEADMRVVDELVKTVNALAAANLCDAVMVTAHTVGPTRIENDTLISTELADRLRRNCPLVRVHYVRDDLSPGELAWLYGQMGAMIAIRLHAAILAMLNGTPTFAISYFTHKTAGVMEAAGLGDCVGAFGTVTAGDIVAALSPRIGSDDVRSSLVGTVRRYREQLDALCIDLMSDLLESRVAERDRAG